MVAQLTAKEKIEVTDAQGNRQAFECTTIILATGAKTDMFLNFLSMEHMSGAIKEALVPEQLPKSLLVVGSGAIGSEFASLYQDLGCQVTLIDLAKQILPTGRCRSCPICQKTI